MLNIDICCCTYNSAKWFDTFFAAMENVHYDKKKLHLFFTGAVFLAIKGISTDEFPH